MTRIILLFIQLQKTIHSRFIFFCYLLYAPHSLSPRLTFIFFKVTLTDSLFIVSKPGFSFNTSVSNRIVQRLLPSGHGPQANAANSTCWLVAYLTGCPGRSSSSRAFLIPRSKYFFLVRQTVILSTLKKSSISVTFFPLFNNKRIFIRLYRRKLILPLLKRYNQVCQSYRCIVHYPLKIARSFMLLRVQYSLTLAS